MSEHITCMHGQLIRSAKIVRGTGTITLYLSAI